MVVLKEYEHVYYSYLYQDFNVFVHVDHECLEGVEFIKVKQLLP